MPKRKRKTFALTGFAREPNGRPSRRIIHVRARQELTEKETKSVAIAARQRHTGLTAEQVDTKPVIGQPNAGDVHGVMAMQGALSRDQWLAAVWYLEQRGDYQRSILARDVPHNGSGAVGDSDTYAEWCQDAKAKWGAILSCLTEVGVQVRSPVRSAFDVILERQQYMPHMEGDLKVGLNALYRRFLWKTDRAA